MSQPPPTAAPLGMFRRSASPVVSLGELDHSELVPETCRRLGALRPGPADSLLPLPLLSTPLLALRAFEVLRMLPLPSGPVGGASGQEASVPQGQGRKSRCLG